MQELPYQLQALEPLAGALDIIRYLGGISAPRADVDEICDALDMSDRRFNKAIRRLVTRGYVQMSGDMVYTLTSAGREAAATLAEYDRTHPRREVADDSVNQITRRVVVAVPRYMAAQQANTVVVGIEGANGDNALATETEMVVRLACINGDPFTPEDAILALGNDAVQHAFTVTPDAFDKMRLRVQVYQLGPNPDDINVAGGLYVDADVARAASSGYVAYGSDLSLQVLE